MEIWSLVPVNISREVSNYLHSSSPWMYLLVLKSFGVCFKVLNETAALFAYVREIHLGKDWYHGIIELKSQSLANSSRHQEAAESSIPATRLGLISSPCSMPSFSGKTQTNYKNPTHP